MWILLGLALVLGFVAAMLVYSFAPSLMPERLLPAATTAAFFAVFNAVTWLLVNTDSERTKLWLFVYLPSSVAMSVLVGNYTRRKKSFA